MSSDLNEIGSKTVQGVHYIKFPSQVTDDAIPKLIDDFRQWAKMEVQVHILDFGRLEQATEDFYRAIQGFEVLLRLRNMKMLSINVSDSVNQAIEDLRLESTFNRLQEAERSAPKKKWMTQGALKKMLFRHLVQAAHKSVEVTLHSTVSCDENYLTKVEAIPYDKVDLICVISANNEFLKADFRLLSSFTVLDRFAKTMLGKDVHVDDEMRESMASELLNMIYTQAKSGLNDAEEFNLPGGIPKVIKKPGFGQIKRSGSSNITLMPMVTPMGTFVIEVDFGV